MELGTKIIAKGLGLAIHRQKLAWKEMWPHQKNVLEGGQLPSPLLAFWTSEEFRRRTGVRKPPYVSPEGHLSSQGTQPSKT
jgi:hypothetical protein